MFWFLILVYRIGVSSLSPSPFYTLLYTAVTPGSFISRWKIWRHLYGILTVVLVSYFLTLIQCFWLDPELVRLLLPLPMWAWPQVWHWLDHRGRHHQHQLLESAKTPTAPNAPNSIHVLKQLTNMCQGPGVWKHGMGLSEIFIQPANHQINTCAVKCTQTDSYIVSVKLFWLLWHIHFGYFIACAHTRTPLRVARRLICVCLIKKVGAAWELFWRRRSASSFFEVQPASWFWTSGRRA